MRAGGAPEGSLSAREAHLTLALPIVDHDLVDVWRAVQRHLDHLDLLVRGTRPEVDGDGVPPIVGRPGLGYDSSGKLVEVPRVSCVSGHAYVRCKHSGRAVGVRDALSACYSK
jgi:hypothetical protein